MKFRRIILIVFLLTACFQTANATVLTGEINAMVSETSFSWGNGTDDLFQTWSTTGWHSGYFYGSTSHQTRSNAGIYVVAGLTDPTTIDASLLSYTTSGYLRATSGDTVFFKGTNGYYGAWRIDDIDNTTEVVQGVEIGSLGLLTGQWYFQDDGTGNFSDSSNSPVPEPATIMLFGIGLLGLAGVSRRKK